MTYQTSVTYNRKIIRRAAARFWFRFIAWHGFAAIGVCVVGAIALVLAGDRWVVGAAGAFGVMLLTTSAAVYFVFLRRSMLKFERMTSKSVTFTFSEDRFSTASDLGSSDLSWKAIEKVWRFPDVWLLFGSKTAYITLPVAEIDQVTRDFVVEQVLRHGGRVA